MKVTKAYVKWFELEQKRHGTEVALCNVYFNISWEILKAVGYTGIKLTNRKRKA